MLGYEFINCRRAEEFGYVLPTNVQEQALSILFFGRDCMLHSQVTILHSVNCASNDYCAHQEAWHAGTYIFLFFLNINVNEI
ncbi:hypothetical protein DCAR_0207178 [Daucus carota subsp. sativus]|uniref:DEAD-box RNA helicase Q domain-containing protein n=1 Tax=Daucus carota subsp. sativus TaxID=79200 RepID=A0AAF1APU6_DAUCS|nr:hypothetical protein DCAR_0207178 [Daucus carota subsp. sativus]